MKPRVLVLAETYLPGYLAGGPVRSLASLVQALVDDVEWAILTRDRDFRAAQAYEGIASDRWVDVGNAQVYYAGQAAQGARNWLRVIRQTPHDVLYLNSFFSPMFSLLPLAARKAGLIPRRPLVIAPRGEFSPGAIALKAWKKRPALGVFRALRLHNDVLWHASTAHEAADIEREAHAPPTSICVARNLTLPLRALNATAETAPKPAGDSLRVVFASRISRMKNLAFALRVLQRSAVPVHFTIIGPIEDANYWEECRDQVARMPAEVTVDLKGAMPPDALARELPKHDLFFLPTLGENYGHALVEAWQAGLPVLTSDQTPWRDLQARGLGWDLALCDEQPFIDAIQTAHHCGSVERLRRRQACSEFGAAIVHDDEAVSANRAMFLRAAGGAK